MTGTLRVNRVAPLVLLALALVAGAASVRLAPLLAPALPLVERSSDQIAPQGSAPALLPVRDPDSPGSEPAAAPATNSTPFAGPQAPANAPANESSTTTAPSAGSTSTTTGSATPATGYGAAPSRWSEWPNDIAPAYVPSQTTSKRPPPGNSP